VNDTQLIEELTAALDDVTAPQRMPSGAAGRARARARARRRLTLGLAAAGLAAATALLLAVVVPTRTWWQLTSPAPKVMKDTPVSGSLPVPAANSSGQVSILGHRTVDGQDTIEVKYAPPRGFKPTKYSLWPTEYVWLNATSYLPVRTQVYGLGPVRTTDLAYLPVTQANMAIFKLIPPAAFTRVAPPPFRGDGQPGLGQIP
jgi:hypothetical protein